MASEKQLLSVIRDLIRYIDIQPRGQMKAYGVPVQHQEGYKRAVSLLGEFKDNIPENLDVTVCPSKM